MLMYVSGIYDFLNPLFPLHLSHPITEVPSSRLEKIRRNAVSLSMLPAMDAGLLLLLDTHSP